MTAQGWLQIAIYVGVLTALTPPLGAYMARVYTGERIFLTRIFGPLERGLYRLFRADPANGQDWKSYARSMLWFSVASFGVLYLVLRTQDIQPLQPGGLRLGAVGRDLQHDLVVRQQHQLAVLRRRDDAQLLLPDGRADRAELRLRGGRDGGARGRDPRLRQPGVKELGNFWQDLVRSLLYILLPLSFVGALILVSQGVIQTLDGSETVTTLTGGQQTLALGPAASQIAIKQLGTNGGGFFNVNSAFPFENPTAFSNFVQVLFILLIPAALTATFGRMVGNRRQGWALYAAMAVMLVADDRGRLRGRAERLAGAEGGRARARLRRRHHRRQPGGQGAAQRDRRQHRVGGGDHRGIERLGQLRARVLHRDRRRRAAGQHDDRGGDLRRGRLGAVRDAVVRDPDRVHRRPDGRANARVPGQEDRRPRREARGDRDDRGADAGPRRHGARDLPQVGDPSIYNKLSPQGFSETLYAYTSQSNNNGSAFAGYTGFVQPNAPGNVGAYGITFADLLGGISMLIGRFVPLLAALAVAGSLATKRVSPVGAGTFRTDSPTFVFLLIARDHHRRRAHLLPRPAPRPDRPGPDPAVVLRCDGT